MQFSVWNEKWNGMESNYPFLNLEPVRAFAQWLFDLRVQSFDQHENMPTNVKIQSMLLKKKTNKIAQSRHMKLVG